MRKVQSNGYVLIRGAIQTLRWNNEMETGILLLVMAFMVFVFALNGKM